MRKFGIYAFLRISQKVVLDSVMFKFYILFESLFRKYSICPEAEQLQKKVSFHIISMTLVLSLS